MALLKAVRSLRLEHWCIAAGTIRNKVWDHSHGFTKPTIPSDIDVLIFDTKQTGAGYEKSLEAEFQKLVLDVRWEVVNQATVHSYVGYPKPYTSIVDAMARWADLVTAVGIHLSDDDQLRAISPAGLDDLFNLRLRPNLLTPTSRQVYQDRVACKNWKATWPLLTIDAEER